MKYRKKGIILVIIIAVQVLFLGYAGAKKQEFHIDEIYSYTLSNSYHADKISHDDRLWNTWISGNDLHDLLTVQKGERFAYSTVYRNNTTDCHPPLYYWIMHTVCSLTPGRFSKWSGLSINIGLFALTGVFIFLISNEVIGSEKWKFLPVVLWGFSGLAVDTTTFIRMYMMLTANTACFVFLHVRMFRHGVNARRLVLVWAAIFLGAMTHYYSLLSGFWGCLFFAVYLLRKKEIKNMLIYGLGSCISVAAMLLCYPYAIEQATGSPTNDVGNQVVKDLFNFRLWFSQTKELADTFFSGVSYNVNVSRAFWLIVILLMLVSAVIRLSKREPAVSAAGMKETLWMAGITVLSFLSVTFIGGTYVHMRYIYNLIPIGCIAAAALIERLLQGMKLSDAALIAAAVFAVTNAAYGTLTNSSSYLYRSAAGQARKITALRELPVVFITEHDYAAVPTGNLRVIEQFREVYMAPRDDIAGNDIVSQTVWRSGACVVFVTMDKYWQTGYDLEETFGQVLTEDDIKYEFISKGRFGEYYLVHR